MDLSKNTIIILSSLIIGVCLQLILGSNTIISVIGSLIVMIAPYAASNDYTKEFTKYSGEYTEKWKNFDAETTLSFIDAIKSEKLDPIREKSVLDGFIGFFGSIGMRIICFFVALFFYSNEDPISAAIAIDVSFVPYALFLMKYGVAPGDAFNADSFKTNRVKIENLNAVSHILRSSNVYSDVYTVTGQLQLEHGAHTRVIGAKCSLQYCKKYNDLLCAMISISMNKVQTNTFPYAYFVIVLKGPENEGLTNDLHDILRETVFSLEVKQDDGNSVYVMTKTSGYPTYFTRDDDIDVLLAIIKRAALSLEENCGVSA